MRSEYRWIVIQYQPVTLHCLCWSIDMFTNQNTITLIELTYPEEVRLTFNEMKHWHIIVCHLKHHWLSSPSITPVKRTHSPTQYTQMPEMETNDTYAKTMRKPRWRAEKSEEKCAQKHWTHSSITQAELTNGSQEKPFTVFHLFYQY